MKFILVTNNKIVFDKIISNGNTKNLKKGIYIENGTYKEVIEKVREMVHMGHELLTHPLSGSIKPNETPYRSVLVSAEAGSLDFDSLKIIEESIQTAEKFMKMAKPRNYNERHHNDFMTIDFHVIESGIESLNQIW